MSEMPQNSSEDMSAEAAPTEHELTVQRVVLLSRVQTSRIWHAENLGDPTATPQEKRMSRDRKREAALKLAEFDAIHKGIVPPEE